MDTKMLLDAVLCEVVNGCKDDSGMVDTDEAVKAIKELIKDLIIHVQKIELFSSLGEMIDQCGGNLVITATPLDDSGSEEAIEGDYEVLDCDCGCDCDTCKPSKAPLGGFDYEDIAKTDTFAEYLASHGFDLVDSNGDLVSNAMLNRLIDSYIAYAER